MRLCSCGKAELSMCRRRCQACDIAFDRKRRAELRVYHRERRLRLKTAKTSRRVDAPDLTSSEIEARIAAELARMRHERQARLWSEEQEKRQGGATP